MRNSELKKTKRELNTKLLDNKAQKTFFSIMSKNRKAFSEKYFDF